MTTADGPTPKTHSRWPLGLLGTIALVAGVESYIGARNVDLGTMYTIEWRLMSKAIKKQAAKAEILCFGTSLSSIAVSPLIVEERTGHPTYNLSLSGAQPYASYVMLRHALEAGAHPRAIVVDFKWTSIRNAPAELERIVPEIATLGECARHALDLGDWGFLARIALVKEMPSYACRVQIRDNIAAAIKGEEPTRNHQWLTQARNMRVNKGAHHTPKVPYKGEVDAADGRFFPAEWACNPMNEAYIHKFLDLADARGVPVFLLVPPVSPAAQARLDEQGTTDRYTKFLEGVMARHPGVVALDARRSGYPNEAFYDASHVNRVGTADFSNALADLLKARLDGPAPADRWVAMPRFAGGQGQERIEDFMDSYGHILAAQKVQDDEAKRLTKATDDGVRR
ncbi:MAG TPA: hypothetical protein VGH33_21905 [Isosphaeraceae bacterium]|jgi:hypothetical protein